MMLKANKVFDSQASFSFKWNAFKI
jgi:hypothetical protein